MNIFLQTEYSKHYLSLFASGSFYVFSYALLTLASVALSFYAFCFIFTHKKRIKSVSLSLKSQIYDSYSVDERRVWLAFAL